MEPKLHWRVDNLWPIMITIVSWAFFVGIFVTQTRADNKSTNDKLTENTQAVKDLTQEVKGWKAQFEKRLGKEENISSVVLNVLKLNIK